MLKSTAIILITMSIALSGCQSWKKSKEATALKNKWGGFENIDPKVLSNDEICTLATNHFDQTMWRRFDSDRGKFVEEAISREICPAFRAMKMRQERRKWKEQTKLIETKCSSTSYKIYPPVIEEKIEIRKRTINVGEECLVPNMPRPTDMYDQSKHVDCLLSRDRTETFNEPFKTRVDRNKENRSTAERACISEHQAKLRSGADINSSDFWNMNY
ncbi:hypothetical protein AB8878_03430 [Alphaproteobacteria bacterium LSUCC0226]